MGSPSQARVPTLRLLAIQSFFESFFHSHTRKLLKHTRWRGDQDQRRPSAVAPTSLPCSRRDRSRSSRKLSASWTQTRTASCPHQTRRTLSQPSASPSQTETHQACSERPQAQSTSHRWSHSLPKRWQEALMMTTPSSNPLMHSKLTERLTQTCSPALRSMRLSQNS